MINRTVNLFPNRKPQRQNQGAALPLAPCPVPRSSALPLRSWIVASLLALAPAWATANDAFPDQHPIEAELTRCMETPEGMSTQGMRHCIDQSQAAWDKELNRLWRELMAELGPEAKEKLRASQRQWLAFRDAEYEALNSAYGAMSGTMFQPMHAEALANITRDRAGQLDSLLEAQRVNAQ
ncbi:MAG: lysozyme inhibitor LprI family protein [Lysobacterales bacterium]